MEYLDIVDEKGNPTGRVEERTIVHEQGLRHRTSHVWLMRRRQYGVEVLLQKRSATKDSFPGCYDISSAGHIPSGDDFLISAVRELQEELGLTAAPEELEYIGDLRKQHEAVFYGKLFKDDQISRVFVLWRDIEPEGMQLQASEVEAVLWIPLTELKERVAAGTINHCLIDEEIAMLPEV